MKSMNRKVQKIIVVTMLCMGIFWGTFINESKATNEIKEGTTSNQIKEESENSSNTTNSNQKKNQVMPI